MMDWYALGFTKGFVNMINDIIREHGQIVEGVTIVNNESISLLPVPYTLAYIIGFMYLHHEVVPQTPIAVDTFHTDDCHNRVVVTLDDLYQIGIKEIAG